MQEIPNLSIPGCMHTVQCAPNQTKNTFLQNGREFPILMRVVAVMMMIKWPLTMEEGTKWENVLTCHDPLYSSCDIAEQAWRTRGNTEMRELKVQHFGTNQGQGWWYTRHTYNFCEIYHKSDPIFKLGPKSTSGKYKLSFEPSTTSAGHVSIFM